MTLITGWKELVAVTGHSKPILLYWIGYGGFPKPLTIRRTFEQMSRRAWVRSEVESWLKNKEVCRDRVSRGTRSTVPDQVPGDEETYSAGCAREG